MNKHLVFAQLPKNKRLKKVLNESFGLKGHQLTLFAFGVETKY